MSLTYTAAQMADLMLMIEDGDDDAGREYDALQVLYPEGMKDLLAEVRAAA